MYIQYSKGVFHVIYINYIIIFFFLKCLLWDLKTYEFWAFKLFIYYFYSIFSWSAYNPVFAGLWYCRSRPPYKWTLSLFYFPFILGKVLNPRPDFIIFLFEGFNGRTGDRKNLFGTWLEMGLSVIGQPKF